MGLAMAKLNCWEHKKCGREQGGAKVAELGVCPVAGEVRTHGKNHGRNGGRACWVISGSLCGGKVQGSFAQKLGNCQACDFYLAVKADEGAEYLGSTALLRVLS